MDVRGSTNKPLIVLLSHLERHFYYHYYGFQCENGQVYLDEDFHGSCDGELGKSSCGHIVIKIDLGHSHPPIRCYLYVQISCLALIRHIFGGLNLNAKKKLH